MTVSISRSLHDRLIGAAAASPDAEICGLLFGGADTIEAAEACANVADHPTDSFEIDPAALVAAHRAMRLGGPTIVGCYHSHPRGAASPSPRDAAAASPNGSLWLIVGEGRLCCYRAVADGGHHDRFDAVSHRIKEDHDLAGGRNSR